MSTVFSLDPFLSLSLPGKPVGTGCFALTEGFGEDAAPFSPDALFGENALLGAVLPESGTAAKAFFDVSAPVYLCEEVTSTFAIGHALAKKGLLPAWGAVLATSQTAGRGRFHRRWQSPRGNLYVTFRLPDVPLFRTDAVALVIGVLLATAFDRLGYPLKLKWPNDLLNPDHAKAAGILVENRHNVLLVGMGVNLRVLPDETQLRRERAAPAGLLQAADGRPLSIAPFVLWRALVNETVFAYSQSLDQSATGLSPDMVDRFLAWKGESVVVSDTEGIIQSGSLTGVSPTGRLVLQTADGITHEIFRGSLAKA